MSETVRKPKQVRSIETKKRIVEAGYVMFAEKGYFNTNTAEIAKKAGVSTGIVYGYTEIIDQDNVLILTFIYECRPQTDHPILRAYEYQSSAIF